VDSTFYTTASVLRTIEAILGLAPLSQYDAGATPLWNAFTRRPDATPFFHLPNTWPLHELNPSAFRSRIPASDLAEADAADEMELNREIWESVRPGERMPAPRSAILQDASPLTSSGRFRCTWPPGDPEPGAPECPPAPARASAAEGRAHFRDLGILSVVRGHDQE